MSICMRESIEKNKTKIQKKRRNKERIVLEQSWDAQLKRVAIFLFDLFRATYCHRYQSAKRYERFVKVNDIHQIAQFNSDIAIFSRERHVTSNFNNKDKKNTLAKFESQKTLKTTIKIFRRKRSNRRKSHSHLVYCQFLLSHQAFAQLTLFNFFASKAIWIYD